MLSPSEAIIGFAAWLTCRDDTITIGAKHDAAIMAELVYTFCKINNLPGPQEDWTKQLVQPKESKNETIS